MEGRRPRLRKALDRRRHTGGGAGGGGDSTAPTLLTERCKPVQWRSSMSSACLHALAAGLARIPWKQRRRQQPWRPLPCALRHTVEGGGPELRCVLHRAQPQTLPLFGDESLGTPCNRRCSQPGPTSQQRQTCGGAAERRPHECRRRRLHGANCPMGQCRLLAPPWAAPTGTLWQWRLLAPAGGTVGTV